MSIPSSLAPEPVSLAPKLTDNLVAGSVRVFSFTILITSLFLPLFAEGNNAPVIINELAWMGNTNSANDEWIELFNNADNSLELEGWVLKSSDERLKINLSGTIPAKNFYLLERTDDNTVPTTTADLIYKGALKNEGEDLRLYDNSGYLIDEINASLGWPAGDNITKQTMERTDSGDWQTSRDANGTPKLKNSVLLSSVIPILSPSPLPSSTPLIDKTAVSGIVINEVLPSPDGPDETEEWIEILNQNDFKVDLSGWQICDFSGKTKEYTLPTGAFIEAFGFLVLRRPETGIILNNSEDKLSLTSDTGRLSDEIYYQNAPRGQSLARFGSKTAWTAKPTPGTQNLQSDESTGQADSAVESFSAKIPLSGKDSSDDYGSVIKLSVPRVLAIGLLTAFIFSAILMLTKIIILKNRT